jgi:hypothetical protein
MKDYVLRLKRSLFGVGTDSRDFILDQMPKGSICAEIGVWKGSFSERIYWKTNPKKLHLIDPWAYSEEYSDAWFGGTNSSPEEMQNVFLSVKQKFKIEERKGRIQLHRAYSNEVASLFDDHYFDWIYIDGNHEYDYVKKDIALFLPKIKLGGYIAGDDYGEGGWWNGGVKKAVDEFISEGLVSLQLLKDSQFILKIV